MSEIRITAHNVHDFPIGTRCRFHWGCPVDTGGADWEGPQVEDALVIGFAVKPKTKWFDEMVVLLCDTENNRTHEVSSFVTVGIGCYLVDEVTA